jgi:hypothetical protein
VAADPAWHRVPVLQVHSIGLIGPGHNWVHLSAAAPAAAEIIWQGSIYQEGAAFPPR